MAESFNKYRTGTILCMIGGLVGAIIGGAGLSFLSRLPPSYGTLISIFMHLYSGMIIGGVIALIGLGVAGPNPQTGGTIAIVGSIVGGINVLTLVGGIFLRHGRVKIKTDTESTTPSPGTKGGVPALDIHSGAELSLRTRRETREKDAQKIRCPSCRKKIPATAMYCPACRALLTINPPD